jgi:hypothetical protein
LNVSIDEFDYSCLHRQKIPTAILKRGKQGISKRHLVLGKTSSSIFDYIRTRYRNKRSENSHLEITNYISPATTSTRSSSYAPAQQIV